MRKPLFKINTLQFVSIIYWLFLTYMIAAFIWWYVSLENQNNQLASIKFDTIQLNDPAIVAKVNAINAFKNRKQKQFLGEGVTFLFLFLLGAVYVYRALKKQIKYSNQQQNFMMAVTHELKTPIAVTQLNIETLIKRDLSDEQQKQLLKSALKETQRLDILCNNILLTSQLEGGDYQENFQLLNLSTLLQQSFDSFKERFASREWQIKLATNCEVIGEPLLLQMLLNNLLDNAHKYAAIDTPILVELKEQHGKIIFSVTDQGEGLAASDKEKIFEKFYRVGTEFTRTSKGTGLGLYLCKKIAQLHSGQLLVTDNQPKGSVFSFIFPKGA
jgi:signal transduction histidine kinase